MLARVQNFLSNRKQDDSLGKLVKQIELKALINRLQEDTKNTPDVSELASKPRQAVFIADSRLHRECFYPDDVEYRGRAFTARFFQSYLFNGEVPLFFDTDSTDFQPSWAEQTDAHPAVVRGSVYIVPSDCVFTLDKRFNNMYNFIRKMVPIVIWRARVYWNVTEGGRKVSKHSPVHAMAWMYVANPEAWRVDGGYNYKPLELYSSQKAYKPKQYYYHSLRRTA